MTHPHFSLKASVLMIKCFNLSYITDSHVGGFSANTISKVKFIRFPAIPSKSKDS